MQTKKGVTKNHLVPAFGAGRLDQIGGLPYARGVLVARQRLDVPALGAHHASVDVRFRTVRVGYHTGIGVTTDFALLDRAAPFVHAMRRSTLTLAFAGEARFEEGERQAFFREGELIVSDAARGGTEAYAGARTARLVLDWDPEAIGARIAGPFSVHRLAPRDVARLQGAAERLASTPAVAAAEVLAMLRALGFAFEELAPEPRTPALDALHEHVAARLADLSAHPSVDEVAEDMGWNRRMVARRLEEMARDYKLAQSHWRERLHAARMKAAMQLLSTPRATTEIVARLAGFRAPAALCRAFANAGWPSPGTLARAARVEPLGHWSQLATPRVSRETNGAHLLAG